MPVWPKPAMRKWRLWLWTTAWTPGRAPERHRGPCSFSGAFLARTLFPMDHASCWCVYTCMYAIVRHCRLSHWAMTLCRHIWPRCLNCTCLQPTHIYIQVFWYVHNVEDISSSPFKNHCLGHREFEPSFLWLSARETSQRVHSWCWRLPHPGWLPPGTFQQTHRCSEWNHGALHTGWSQGWLEVYQGLLDVSTRKLVCSKFIHLRSMH